VIGSVPFHSPLLPVSVAPTTAATFDAMNGSCWLLGLLWSRPVALPATTSAMSAATPTRRTPTVGVRCCISVPFSRLPGSMHRAWAERQATRCLDPSYEPISDEQAGAS
jgi:hypothetical protein